LDSRLSLTPLEPQPTLQLPLLIKPQSMPPTRPQLMPLLLLKLLPMPQLPRVKLL